MNILCNWLGHKFKHEETGFKTKVAECFGSSSNVLRTYDGVYVKKHCQRCGYTYSDTFEIQGTSEKPL